MEEKTYQCALCARSSHTKEAFYRIPPEGMAGKFYAAGMVTQDEKQSFLLCPLCYGKLNCYQCHAKGARPRVILRYKNNPAKNIIQIVCQNCIKKVYKEY